MSFERLDMRPPVNAGAVTDLQGLRELKARAADNAPEALEAVAEQFEALFLGMMLDSMRAATLGGGLEDSSEMELYQQLFDRQVAANIAAGRGLGIARLLVEQLSRAAPASEGPADGGPAASDEPETAAALAGSPGQFIQTVLPHAKRAAAELGVHPMALVAQAALETGWGGRLPRRADGEPSLNLFGVKAGESWQGGRAVAGTVEYVQGVAVRRTEQFRAYDSLGQAFADYVRLIKTSPRYAEARAAGSDPVRYADALQAAGYATDPRYAAKIREILDSEPMAAAASSLKSGGAGPIT